MGRVFTLQLIRKRWREGIEIFARTFPPRFFDNCSKKREDLEKRETGLRSAKIQWSNGENFHHRKNWYIVSRIRSLDNRATL